MRREEVLRSSRHREPRLQGSAVWVLGLVLLSELRGLHAWGAEGPMLGALRSRMSVGGTSKTKIVHFVRHGQAMHNPRAEAAREKGCSYQEFLDLMKADDAFDADLTDRGVQQAHERHEEFKSVVDRVDLVVSSSLSRALDTANIVAPAPLYPSAPRVALDTWREISGLLVNAQRRNKTDLKEKYAGWDFDELKSEQDDMWPEDRLEEEQSCANRAHAGLQWLWEREEENIALFAHGGIFSFLMNRPGHPNVRCDEGMRARFHNCEMRSCQLSVIEEGEEGQESTKVFVLERL